MAAKRKQAKKRSAKKKTTARKRPTVKKAVNKAVRKVKKAVKKAAKKTSPSKRKASAKKARSGVYRAIVRTLCQDGTITTSHDMGTGCSTAYTNAEARSFRFCLVHGGVQKHTRVSCKPE